MPRVKKMFEPNHKTIIIGYGNPGRQDDGLGQSFINQLSHQLTQQWPQKDLLQIRLQTNYQLTVEDAYDIFEFEQVIFVDASLNATAPYSFTNITETNNSGLGSHCLTPNAVLRLCETLYGKRPKAFILAIRGYEFDRFEERLTSQANSNMLAAVTFFMAFFGQGAVTGDNNLEVSAHA